ncbi:DsbA family oxidoreductase [Shimazuella kribbensis]|uniref:DsbA family oxidoreductase n=1 Tax=Shimazuella kribbensis TaxID=139808 RepID=UPI000401A9B3|nr:DsbA family oxidoreductase [Shimazuella kribbensis]
MIIDIYQDTVCPWCWIGKKNMMDAISQWETENNQSVTIRYHSFLLDPNLPEEGRGFREVMAEKMGSERMVDQATQQVTGAGAAVGVPFRFENVTRMPNTILSHALIKMAPEKVALPLVEAIFKAYFYEGQDIGELDVLVSIAEKVGMDPIQVRNSLLAGEYKEEVRKDLQNANELNISGVPFFVIDNKLALSGAHSKENFLKAFAEAK